jgi:hypothetical protein
MPDTIRRWNLTLTLRVVHTASFHERHAYIVGEIDQMTLDLVLRAYGESLLVTFALEIHVRAPLGGEELIDYLTAGQEDGSILYVFGTEAEKRTADQQEDERTSKTAEPSVEASAPSVEASAPSVEASAPSGEESAPSVEESAPSVEESAPFVEAPAPAEQEPAPIAAESPEASKPQSIPESPESDIPESEIAVDAQAAEAQDAGETESNVTAHVSSSQGSPESNGEGAAPPHREPNKADLINLKVRLFQPGRRWNLVKYHSVVLWPGNDRW